MDSSGSKNPLAESQRDYIFVPLEFSSSSLEWNLPGLRKRRSLEVAQQCVTGLVVADVITAIDVAITCAVLERDVPLPPRCVGNRPGVGANRARWTLRALRWLDHRVASATTLRSLFATPAQSIAP